MGQPDRDGLRRDIIITMNMQAEIENIGQLTDAVAKLKAEA